MPPHVIRYLKSSPPRKLGSLSAKPSTPCRLARLLLVVGAVPHAGAPIQLRPGSVHGPSHVDRPDVTFEQVYGPSPARSIRVRFLPRTHGPWLPRRPVRVGLEQEVPLARASAGRLP